MSGNGTTAPAFIPDRPVAVIDVPVDERDERALPLAARLADLWGLPVRLLHVNGPGQAPTIELERMVAEATERHPGVTFQALPVEGEDVAAAIGGAAESTSLLIVPTDNANAWSFKNSVAERLVDQTPVPLILVGQRSTVEPIAGDVVVAFDGRPAAKAALGAATALAPALGRALWLVQVVPDSPDRDTAADEEVEQALLGHIGALDPALGGRGEVVRSNDPIGAIEAFAERVGASFVVAAARGRADATRTTMSSITMGLVASAGRPVLVVGH